MPKMVNLAKFVKSKGCGQTVLPDRSILIGQKLVENAKIDKFKSDILSDFQTMCTNSYPFGDQPELFEVVQWSKQNLREYR